MYLEIDDIHTYYGSSHVLRGVSLSVEQEEIVGLFGRNGAGKTTTLASITGLQPPKEGAVTFDGTEITHKHISTISRSGIKLVPEDRRTFSGLTVEENLRLSQSAESDSEWPLSRVFDEFPQLEKRRAQKAGHLSGGEQQMLAIAQALLSNSKLILLDEPLEGLAPQIVAQIMELVRTINDAGKSILWVEQNLSVPLELIDRGYILHKGEIAFSGSQEKFRSSPDEVDRYLSVSAGTTE
jgi:branched-chain amino acid transport system ATP-binding protein